MERTMFFFLLRSETIATKERTLLSEDDVPRAVG
jgi:hypothetical protein